MLIKIIHNHSLEISFLNIANIDPQCTSHPLQVLLPSRTGGPPVEAPSSGGRFPAMTSVCYGILQYSSTVVQIVPLFLYVLGTWNTDMDDPYSPGNE